MGVNGLKMPLLALELRRKRRDMEVVVRILEWEEIGNGQKIS